MKPVLALHRAGGLPFPEQLQDHLLILVVALCALQTILYDIFHVVLFCIVLDDANLKTVTGDNVILVT